MKVSDYLEMIRPPLTRIPCVDNVTIILDKTGEVVEGRVDLNSMIFIKTAEEEEQENHEEV